MTMPRIPSLSAVITPAPSLFHDFPLLCCNVTVTFAARAGSTRNAARTALTDL